ncbi:hypothetical protein FA13DRAFT_1318171 [Coprinellus micaceus]|uniref:Uncharacterized protein n=1 Tax=Coprinellus micaceus TaxID=71717 RepID=A0A4Y7SS14_COPMI|nr:hypothetical protein FA13DRAFT_1318171 [Coprinellus micaceus]
MVILVVDEGDGQIIEVRRVRRWGRWGVEFKSLCQSLNREISEAGQQTAERVGEGEHQVTKGGRTRWSPTTKKRPSSFAGLGVEVGREWRRLGLWRLSGSG